MQKDFPPIHSIRRMRVMLDSDLARLYCVTTTQLNQAIKRNADRFPEDFRFQLTREEYVRLISQIVISNAENTDDQANASRSSQFAMSSNPGRGGLRKMPWAFTDGVRQHGDGVARRSRAARRQHLRVSCSGCPLGNTANNTAR